MTFNEDHTNPCGTRDNPIEVRPEEDISSDSPSEAEAARGNATPLEPETWMVTFGGIYLKASYVDKSSVVEIQYVRSSEEEGSSMEEPRRSAPWPRRSYPMLATLPAQSTRVTIATNPPRGTESPRL